MVLGRYLVVGYLDPYGPGNPLAQRPDVVGLSGFKGPKYRVLEPADLCLEVLPMLRILYARAHTISCP